MKTEVFISIVAAGSALIGAAIPTIMGYLNNLKQNQFERERTLLEKQKDVYWDLVVSLQNTINETNDDNLIEMP